MLNKRSEILKNMCFGKSSSVSGVEFTAECKNCGKLIKGPSCISCKKCVMHCVLCRLPVRGAANVCLGCGHGGHTKHLEHWFSVSSYTSLLLRPVFFLTKYNFRSIMFALLDVDVNV